MKTMQHKAVRKALISAAGKGTRHYPASNAVQKELFPLVDRNGITKPAIQMIAEEALLAGIEEIAIIVQPASQDQFQNHFKRLDPGERNALAKKPASLQQAEMLDNLNRRITYIHQRAQEGFGHAIYCAREWAGDEPFLLMLGDHLYLSDTDQCCARQVISAFDRFGKSVFAVKQTPAELITLFGTASGIRIQKKPAVYKLTKIVEKPEIKYARDHLQVLDLPHDTFLCFFGLYVLTSAIFGVLEKHIQNNIRLNGEIQLTTAQAELCAAEGALGAVVQGTRMDMGTPEGYIETQLTLALNGVYASKIKKYYRNVQNENENKIH